MIPLVSNVNTHKIPILLQDFGKIVDKSVQDLKAEFREGLQEKCEASAELVCAQEHTELMF